MSGNNPSSQEPMHIDSDEASQVPTSSSTDTCIARSDKRVPGLPRGIFARGNMRRTTSQQSQAGEAPTIPAALDSRLQRMDRVLGLFDPCIRQSSDAQHLSYNALPQALRILATELDRTRGEIRSGTRYIGTEYPVLMDGCFKWRQRRKCYKWLLSSLRKG